MNAQEWKQLISAYADGALSPDDAASAERLLAERQECRAYLEELRRLSSSFHVLPDETLSPDAELKILSNINKERSMKPNQWKATAAVAATVLVVVLALQTYTQRGLQGRLRDATVRLSSATDSKGLQYEPYYSPNRGRLASATDDIGDQYATRALVSQYRPIKAAASQQSQSASMLLAQTRAKHAESFDRTDYSQAGMENEPYYSSTTTRGITTVAKAGTIYAETDQLGIDLKESSRRYYYDQYVPYVPGNTEEYNAIDENRFLTAMDNPLSTLSTDVDTASYSNIRRFLSQHQMPPRDSVRIEEMINYFSYNYPLPSLFQPFSITTDLAICPWNTAHQLMRVGLKGKIPVEFTLPASNLVFLIDVSGSMADQDKLPLLKEGFKMMVQNLRPQDYVSIVVYSDRALQVLAPTSGADKHSIIRAIDSLRADGSTAGGEGLRLAYQVARGSFIRGGNNRVILATDGDFNVGPSSTADMTRLIEQERKSGVYLTILGFGQGNLKDDKMMGIADNGNGSYFYIDSLQEAQKVLVNELGSTLFTIAKDVKIQVEFNPAAVKAYRLIGYEKRILASEDFNNDRKDAGEIGAGHTVTALYEIIPTGFWKSFESAPKIDQLKYQRRVEIARPWITSNEVATVKLRYKDPDGNSSKLITRMVKKTDSVRCPTGDFAWASAVAEFGMLLRGSENRGYASYDHALNMAQNNIENDPNGFRTEFLNLIETARRLDPQPQPQPEVWQEDDYSQYYSPNQGSGEIHFK